MKRFIAACLATVISVAGSGLVQAGTITVTDPDYFATDTAPALTSNAQAKIGTGSWQANGTAKSSISFSPEDLGFSSSITISDVQSMSFSTYKSTTGGSVPDWYLTIYTAPTTAPNANNGSSWYGLRMTWEGLYANSFSNPADQWNTYSTAAGTNQLTMYDSNTTFAGFYGAPTLSDIQDADGVIDWPDYSTSGSTATFDYNESPIMAFVLETGSGWADGFEGYLDEFQVTVNDVTSTVDFEPAAVPEPASMAVWGLLGMGCATGSFMRRRRRANSALS